MRSILRLSTAIASASLMIAMSAPFAGAHDSVIGGNPANGDELQEFPDVIALEFSGYVKEDFNTFAVSDADTDEVLFSGTPTVDQRWVSIAVPKDVEPGPGNYRIGFQITSSDGHSTRGMTNFKVAGEDESSGSDDAVVITAAEEDSASVNPWIWIAVGLLVAALAVGGILIASKGRK
ncbi:copper resistance protein CopC [Corynebacterium breve]|uniref:Copper resistance protein CopC n=1 Tax=Corynebacterium breve TaxID=3049799 RepID=A0ABY8VH31_9CORY|nr:copper resistance protein CopC [Corynebacterium breve]WIM68964.1 copper resistance protein CopC [Corynebacterium breve]